MRSTIRTKAGGSEIQRLYFYVALNVNRVQFLPFSRIALLIALHKFLIIYCISNNKAQYLLLTSRRPDQSRWSTRSVFPLERAERASQRPTRPAPSLRKTSRCARRCRVRSVAYSPSPGSATLRPKSFQLFFLGDKVTRRAKRVPVDKCHPFS